MIGYDGGAMNKKIIAVTTLLILALAGAGRAFQEKKDKPAAPKTATPVQQDTKTKSTKPDQKTKPKATENKGDEAGIKAVLDAQKAAWNAKKLDGFMDSYWKSKDLTFLSGAKVLHGWGAVRNRYQKDYPSEKMGTLDFSNLEIRLLGKSFAYVLGQWALDIGGEKKGGAFTLILRHTPKGWRIMHDHTV
jgi:ketosteroid isomerase-like protein